MAFYILKQVTAHEELGLYCTLIDMAKRSEWAGLESRVQLLLSRLHLIDFHVLMNKKHIEIFT